MEHLEAKPEQFEEVQLQKTFAKALRAARHFFDCIKYTTDQDSITSEDVLHFMTESDVFKSLHPMIHLKARRVIREKLDLHLEQRRKVAFYRQNYLSRLHSLLENVFEKPLPSAGKNQMDAIWEPDCVTVVTPNKIYDALMNEDHSANRSVGCAFTNGKALNLCRQNTESEIIATHIHETKHQRNALTLPRRVLPIDFAQDEVLSFTEEDYGWTRTLATLTRPDGTYDYFAKRKRAAKTKTQRRFLTKDWQVHCRDIAKGIQVAALLGKDHMDEFSTMLMSEWKTIPTNPPQDDFFSLGGERRPVEGEIAQILRAARNRELVSEAGFGDPEGLARLLPKSTHWLYSHAPSGILTFKGVTGKADGIEVVLIPSLSAINTHRSPRESQNL